MNTRKLCGAVAAAIFTFALSGAASADLTDAECVSLLDSTVGDVKQLQTDLACMSYPDAITGITGKYPSNNPIWQYRLKKKKNSFDQGDGCEVHYKLSKLLLELAQEKKGKGKGNSGFRGAYAALLDGQYQYAYDLLGKFNLNALDATTEPEFNNGDGVVKQYDDADAAVKHFLGRGMIIQGQIDTLKTECPTT